MLSVGTRIEALMGLSRALVGLDSLDSALAVLESGYGLVQNEGVQEKLALFGIHMGETLMRLGRDEEAIEHFLSAERQAEHSERINYRIWALTLAARTYLDQGEPERALDLLIKASGLWETLRQLPFEPEWRERWSEAARRLYTNLAACLLEIPAEPETDRTRQAFDRMQAFKARTLQERMLGPGEDLTTFAAQRNLELTTLEQLQRSVLQPGELFLDFYLGPDTSFVFAVNCQECRVAGLRNGGDMGETLRRYHSILSGSGGDGVSERAAKTLEDIAGRVSQVILGDVWDLVQDSDRIFVSPDGALHLVPFAYLGADVRDDPAREWIRVPSATILTWLRDGTRSNEYASGPTILAVAGSGEESGRSLPGAVKEVRDLGRRYRDVHVHVSDSRETAMDIDVLSGPDVIHIATHLAMDDQNPWQSTIRSIRGHRDEAIRTGEIASMELSARLAVLSSCESAGGRVLSGEGVLGLSSAFLSAGVPAVVASLWPVSDRATARFMEHFYRAIADGNNVVTALNTSRQTMRADTETRHPFYWAGFVIIGDGDMKVPLTMRRRFPWFVVLGILPLVGGAGFLIRRQRFNQRRG
jgi:tetratricopeptide (TPR) repeat protein